MQSNAISLSSMIVVFALFALPVCVLGTSIWGQRVYPVTVPSRKGPSSYRPQRIPRPDMSSVRKVVPPIVWRSPLCISLNLWEPRRSLFTTSSMMREWEQQLFERTQVVSPGLFFSTNKAKEIVEMKNKKRMNNVKTIKGLRITYEHAHDYDTVCPTQHSLVPADSYMRNIHGILREIINFPTLGEYQFIDNGICVDKSLQHCSGTCFQETSIVYLMVWNPDVNAEVFFMFEPFDIPSYCSCKNVFPG